MADEAFRPKSLDLIGAEEVPLAYSDAVFVSATRDDICVSFFQYTRPIFKSQEESDKVETLPTRCVARIVLPERGARILLAFLQGGIQQLEEIKKIDRGQT